MGVCCSCCRRKTIEEDDDEDDLAATTATAAKDADAKDVKVDIDAAVSSLDAGTVEIVVARLRTVDARAKAFEERDLPLVLTLYYRRMSPHAVEGGRGADGTWVIVDKKECLPNRHEKGAMVVNFRERALRELSRHKAPVFKLPAAFDLNCPMQLVCRDPGGALDSDEDSDDDANGSSFSGGTPSRPTTPAGTSVTRGSTPFKDGVNRPVARRERGGRSAPRTVGELKFTMRDLVHDAPPRVEDGTNDDGSRRSLRGRRNQDRGRHAEADAGGDDQGVDQADQTPHAQGAPVVRDASGTAQGGCEEEIGGARFGRDEHELG